MADDTATETATATRPEPSSPPEQGGHSRYLFFALSALGVLMAAIDSTIVAVALPELQTALHASLAWIGWTLTAYQLVQVIMLPLSGKLSDTLGRKRVFLFCLGCFTLGSFLCAISPSIGFLIGARAIQALGGGGLMPSAVGIVSDQFKERRASAIGLFTSIFPIGGIIGPNLGGYLLQEWGWRSLFTINVPLGIVVIIGVALLLPKGEAAAGNRLHLDLVGLGLFASAVVALLYGMTALSDNVDMVKSPVLWVLFVAAVVLFVLFLRHIKRAPDPVVSFDLMARNPFLSANLYNFFFGAASFGFFSFVPYYAVVKYHMSAYESGAVLTPRAIAMILVSTVASFFIIRLGYHLPMLAGMAFVEVSLLLLGQGWNVLHLGGLTLSGFWLMAAIITISGIGMGLASPASNNAAIDLAPEKAAEITGLRGMYRMTGGIISISGVVLALSFFQDKAHGLTMIFLVLAGVLLITIPLTLMIPDTAREMRRQGLGVTVKRHGAPASPAPPARHEPRPRYTPAPGQPAAGAEHGHHDD
ncbi:MAG TPA: MFS transporter [Thermomicrobiales bacterium]|nr:MFS transporter [Thermomicrobiales bacterium]